MQPLGISRALALLALGGCGFGLVDSGSGGGEHLPTLGAGPYGRLEPDFDTPADEPFVVAARDEDYADPACLRRAGGGYRLWFTLGDGAIGYAEVGDLHEVLAVGPIVVLADAAAPSVTVAPDGTLEMWFERGGGLAVARSSDGLAWEVGDETVADATDPAVVYAGGERHLFFERDGEVWRGDAPVADGGEPHVVVERSAAGRDHWGLWLTRPTGREGAGEVYYLGSFDGAVWEPFGPDPVLVAPAGGPCVVVERARGTLFFHEEQRLRLGVAAAVHP